MFVCVSDEGGVLVHCISGWDRTPLFISLIRLSLWAVSNRHNHTYLSIGVCVCVCVCVCVHDVHYFQYWSPPLSHSVLFTLFGHLLWQSTHWVVVFSNGHTWATIVLLYVVIPELQKLFKLLLQMLLSYQIPLHIHTMYIYLWPVLGEISLIVA